MYFSIISLGSFVVNSDSNPILFLPVAPMPMEDYCEVKTNGIAFTGELIYCTPICLRYRFAPRLIVVFV